MSIERFQTFGEDVMRDSFKDVIGAQEVAAILGWDENKVYRMTRESRLPYVKKIGRVYLYSLSEIKKILKGETSGANVKGEEA